MNPFAEDRPAIVTDISDFYQRIYFHRIENVLEDAGCPKGPADLVKKIIKTTRARQSYGLPVGSAASEGKAKAARELEATKKRLGLGEPGPLRGATPSPLEDTSHPRTPNWSRPPTVFRPCFR